MMMIMMMMMMMMMIIIIIIIIIITKIIALKGAIQDLFINSSLRCELSPTQAKVARAQSRANHV